MAKKKIESAAPVAKTEIMTHPDEINVVAKNITIVNAVSSESYSKEKELDLSKLFNLERTVKGITNVQLRVMTDYDFTDIPILERFTTGDTVVDAIMGGGIPNGKQIEIIGKQSSGKSTLAQHIVNSIVNNYNGYALVFDHEDKAWDFPNRNLQLGLDPKKLNHISYGDADTIESVFDIMKDFIVKIVVKNKVRKAPVIIVVDSIAAYSSRKEAAASSNEQFIKDQARIMAERHRTLRTTIAQHGITNVIFLYLNQARESFMQSKYKQSEIETFGGKAIRFFAAIRIMLEHQKQLAVKVGLMNIPVGIAVRAKTIKNKTFSALQTADLRVIFRSGFDHVFNIWDWGTKLGVIKESTQGNKVAGLADYRMMINGEWQYFNGGKEWRDFYLANKLVVDETVKTYYTQLLNDCTNAITGMGTEHDLSIVEEDDTEDIAAVPIPKSMPTSSYTSQTADFSIAGHQPFDDGEL